MNRRESNISLGSIGNLSVFAPDEELNKLLDHEIMIWARLSRPGVYPVSTLEPPNLTQKTPDPNCNLESYTSDPHESILRLIEVLENEDAVFIVSEYCDGGNLLDYLMKMGNGRGIPENLARVFWERVCYGVEWMHGRGVVHRVRHFSLNDLMIGSVN